MNVLPNYRILIYSLVTAGMVLFNSSAGFSQKDSLHVRVDSLKPPGSQEKELAKKLANELKKVGINTDENELKDITDAMAKGGQGAMAIAQMIITTIAEIELHRQPQEKSTKKKSEVSDKQFQDLLRSTGKGKDTSLWISQYLRGKLIQVRKDGH